MGHSLLSFRGAKATGNLGLAGSERKPRSLAPLGMTIVLYFIINRLQAAAPRRMDSLPRIGFDRHLTNSRHTGMLNWGGQR